MYGLVGGGMQDFAKDDLGLLGSNIVNSEKDLLGHSHPQQPLVHHHVGSHQIHLHPTGGGGVGLVGGIGVDDIKLTHIPDLLEPADGSKLEESERDLYPWHTGSNIGSRFLRSSDDPLISGGTNDNPHDNELSVPTVSQSMCPSPTTPPPKHRHPSVVLSPELRETTLSPLPTPPKASTSSVQLNTNVHQKEQRPVQQQQKRTNSGAPPRARRKGPLKLRFHHQALPQEYLDHYEATQNNLQRKETAPNQSSKQSQKQQTAQQSRKAMMERQAAQEREERANESVRSWLQKILELQKEGVSLAPLKDEVVPPAQDSPPSAADSGTINQNGTPTKRIVNYTDLPYMGEITLDNSKPRRGRKPKKADICHLIYKNYGTILPGTPNRELGPEKSVAMPKGCSKSVASLLERRLTSSDERKTKPAEPPEAKSENSAKGRRKEEPLNLCVRDSGGSVSNRGVLGGESFSLSSSEEDPEDAFASSCPTPIITPSDICTDQALAANMKLSLPTLQSSSGSTTETPSTADTPPGCMYWSTNAASSSLFAHPMSMYYPPATPSGEDSSKTSDEHIRLGRSSRLGAPSSTASSPPISPNGLKGEHQQQQPMLVPKHISMLMKHDKQSAPSSGSQRSPPAQKRKRSAIFIPPVPAENSSNPATEQGPAGGPLAGDPTSPAPSGGSQPGRMHPNGASERRRRKSRRATQRESLEKTFKEKGFLIQTQQLQSAEGATYCKFRQLRKFTRYLFRSWKDYLPGELQQQEQHPQHALLQDGELSGMTLPPVVTSTRDTPPNVHGDDRGPSLLASSTRSLQMETIEICESPHRRNSPDSVAPNVTAQHRLRQSRRTSTASATSQHVHSETLVIDSSYHHRSASPQSDRVVNRLYREPVESRIGGRQIGTPRIVNAATSSTLDSVGASPEVSSLAYTERTPWNVQTSTGGDNQAGQGANKNETSLRARTY
uniref:Uncharacterized protein n=1 Tax=Anopheles atroparvus TaxID=41427 RepID=A0A182IWF4_ANOAO